jgi:glycosyltransferase involved in cell wall biosynthesis
MHPALESELDSQPAVMRVLFLTDNFPPETNAPATRTYEHAKRWVAAGCGVTVVTGAPNFPAGRLFPGYRNRLWQRETVDGIDVVRVWTYITANEGMLRRTLDYVSFMVSATVASLFLRRADVVIATSPQFFAAVAGWMAAALRRRPFVMEVRDLWPDSIVAVGAMQENATIRMLRRLEHFLYRRAARIVSVTESFRRIIASGGISAEKIAVVRNGADLRDFTPAPKPVDLVERLGLQGHFVAGYIGTIGMAHGLATLLDAAAALKADDRIRFVVVGDGAERATLEREIRDRALTNVRFVGPVSRAEVLRYWQVLDAAVVLLRDTAVFRTVLPSKMFEAMACAKPIVLGVRGEACDLLEDARAGVAIPPEDPAALVSALRGLAEDPAKARALGAAGRDHVVRHFDRDRLALQMLEELKIAAHR